MTFLIEIHCSYDCLHHLGLSGSILHGGDLSGTKAGSALQTSVSWSPAARVSVLIFLWPTFVPRWITNAPKPLENGKASIRGLEKSAGLREDLGWTTGKPVHPHTNVKD